MRTLIGIVLGISSMVVITSRYGQQWSDSLHAARGVAAGVTAGIEQAAEIVLPGAAVLAEVAPVAEDPAAQDQTPVTAGSPSAAYPDGAPPDGAPPDGAPPELQMDTTARQWAEFRDRREEAVASGEFPWHNCFRRAAASHEVPEVLLLAVARGESAFDTVARSDRNAVGVMQIRWPLTARHLGITRERQLYDPCTNIDAGARYLRELLDQYGDDYHLALAAYNYGPTRVEVGRVPAAAGRYSQYILDQLHAVLGQTGLESAVQQPAGRQEAGRILLLRFGSGWHAEAFTEFLLETAPDLSLVTQTGSRGDHAVYLSYNSDTERRRALNVIDASGIWLGSAGNPSTVDTEEPSYDF